MRDIRHPEGLVGGVDIRLLFQIGAADFCQQPEIAVHDHLPAILIVDRAFFLRGRVRRRQQNGQRRAENLQRVFVAPDGEKRAAKEPARFRHLVFVVAAVGDALFDHAFEDRNGGLRLSAAQQRHGEIQIDLDITPARDLIMRDGGLQFVERRHRGFPFALRGLPDGDALQASACTAFSTPARS